MNICYICSRYADPDPANRRRNLAEARALARWAEAQGYAVVTWWGSLEPDDPLCDSDETVRAQALARSAELAAMAGKMGGVIIGPAWYQITMGMFDDLTAFVRGHRADVESTKILVAWSEVEPYYRAPVDHFVDANNMIPRAQVQAAVDKLVASEVLSDCECPTCDAIRAMCKAIGVTPTEVQS